MGTSAAGSLPRRRLACPGVADPMESGDGWLLRVRLPGGVVHPDQLDVVADTSERWGRGIVEITARGNVQLRGFPADVVDAAAEALVAGGLALADPSRDARRSVVAPPLTGHDPHEAVAATALTDALVAGLVTASLPGPLPPKFAVVVDTAGALGVGGVPGDLLLVARRDGGAAVEWSAAIGHGMETRWSGVLGACDNAELVAVAVDLAGRCAARGCRADELPSADIDGAAQGRRPAVVRRATTPAAASVGTWDHVDPARVNVVGAPPLGRLQPGELRRLAGLAHRGLGLRVSPSGCVAVVGVRREDRADVTAGLHEAGCSTDPLDGWHAVSACVGTDGCTAARADTLAAVAALVAGRRAGADRSERVHLSGCEKRCGAPRDAPVLIADGTGRFVAAEMAP